MLNFVHIRILLHVLHSLSFGRVHVLGQELLSRPLAAALVEGVDELTCFSF